MMTTRSWRYAYQSQTVAIVKPLGVGGMGMYHPLYIEQLPRYKHGGIYIVMIVTARMSYF